MSKISSHNKHLTREEETNMDMRMEENYNRWLWWGEPVGGGMHGMGGGGGHHDLNSPQ